GGYLTRQTWSPWLGPGQPAGPGESAAAPGATAAPADKVILSDQAQKNLGLTARPLVARTFWKTIQVPGMVVDRPGPHDRGVVAPAAGVVARIARVPGDTVRPGELLFVLRLLSEPLHRAQAELLRTTQDIALARAQRERLAGASMPEARTFEVNNQITRLQVAFTVKAGQIRTLDFTSGR